MPKVFITSKIPEAGITLLTQNGFEVLLNESANNLSSQQLKEVFGKYDAVVTMVSDKIDEDILSGASSALKIVSNYGVGFDNIDVKSANRREIIVTNTPGVANESVAEHNMMLVLACAKQIIEADKYVRFGKYTKWDPGLFVAPQVWGKTIGIVGLGKIGTFVGQIAKHGFRMNVIYYDLVRSEDFELLCEAKYANLDTLLMESDFITIHCPLNDKTHHLINKEAFSKMKSSAILINTARGSVVDEDALIDVLKNRRIAGAGLDVFEHEPNINPELFTLSNVILTPHIASATVETRVAMSRIAAQNIIDVFAQKTPFGLVKV